MPEPEDDRPIRSAPGFSDAVDRGLDEWKAIEADYPVNTIELLARLGRTRGHIERTLNPVYEQHHLTAPEFYLLASLTRRPPEHTLSQSELARSMSLTPGTVSVRVAAMSDRGLLTASSEPGTRGRTVTATPLGLQRFDDCQRDLRFHQDRLFSALDGHQRHTLADLLHRLTFDYEAEVEDLDRHYAILDVTLRPAHLAREQRVAVGLSDRTGLLVTRTAQRAGPGTPRVGDLIVQANGTPVRSIFDLAAAEPVESIVVVRGETEVEIDVSVSAGA